MLIELSVLNSPSKRFWETIKNKQPPVYSISESELKKARVQYSIGITEPRVHVVKVRIQNSIKVLIATRISLNNKDMRLYKDDQGFYLKEVVW